MTLTVVGAGGTCTSECDWQASQEEKKYPVSGCCIEENLSIWLINHNFNGSFVALFCAGQVKQIRRKKIQHLKFCIDSKYKFFPDRIVCHMQDLKTLVHLFKFSNVGWECLVRKILCTCATIYFLELSPSTLLVRGRRLESPLRFHAPKMFPGWTNFTLARRWLPVSDYIKTVTRALTPWAPISQ